MRSLDPSLTEGDCAPVGSNGCAVATLAISTYYQLSVTRPERSDLFSPRLRSHLNAMMYIMASFHRQELIWVCDLPRVILHANLPDHLCL